MSQIILTGGMPLSTAYEAANSNFTELYAGVTGSITNLNSLTDVVITNPQTNQILKYNGTNWVNDTAPSGGGGVSNLYELSDTDISLPQNGDLLVFDGTYWGNVAGNTLYAQVSSVSNLTTDIARMKIMSLLGVI